MQQWEDITNIILITSIVILGIFVLVGLAQLISRRSLKKVDKQLLWLPVPLLLMVIVYFVFDKLLILHTRPDGSGESSFPSTHVMVVATIFFTLTVALPQYVKSKATRIIIELLMLVLIALVSFGRVEANKHWVIDVIGAVVFAFIFSEIYYLLVKRKSKKVKKHEQHIHKNH